jgi:AcrR family transcriptional regulator
LPPEPSSGVRRKREAILAAAVELLLIHGYDGTSMNAVAARAGASKSTVYVHFADKLELFKAVLQHGSEELGRALQKSRELEGAEQASAEVRLVNVLVAASQAAASSEAIAYFRVLIAELNRRREIRAAFDTVHAELPDVSNIVVIVARLLTEFAAEHGFTIDRPDVHATMLLRMTSSGLQFDRLISDFPLSADLLEAHVSYIVRIFIRGLRPIAGEPTPTLPADYDYPSGPALNRLGIPAG